MHVVGLNNIRLQCPRAMIMYVKQLCIHLYTKYVSWIFIVYVVVGQDPASFKG